MEVRMVMVIDGYSFEGPYTSADSLEDRSGVYVILCYRDNRHYFIDVGESATVKQRVENHERKDCWQQNCSGTLVAVVYYTPSLQQPGRMAIEQKIRKQHRIPCGER
jgi:predicted GIY-YIG superfamily endonuclease